MKILMFLPNVAAGLWNQLDQLLCRSLPGPIRFRWAKMWIRKDEFHPSLDSHAEYVCNLPLQKRNLYLYNLIHRRRIAHERDIATT